MSSYVNFFHSSVIHMWSAFAVYVLCCGNERLIEVSMFISTTIIFIACKADVTSYPNHALLQFVLNYLPKSL